MKKTDHPRTPTETQIDANRRNAQKSTGPRTAEGKAASSRNRLLHGLRANKHILLDEDPAEFLFLLHDHLDRFRPEGPSEEKLVLRIAADQWRLDRAIPLEAGIYRDRFHDVADKDKVRQQQYANEIKYAKDYGDPVPPTPITPDEGDLLARAFNVDCEGPNSFAKLARYEGGIERSIDRCLRQLQKYQAARTASAPDPGHQPSPSPRPPSPGPGAPGEPDAPPPETGTPSAATPSKNKSYHSNPKNGGIAQAGVPSGSAAIALVMYEIYALLHAAPRLIAALGSPLTDPRTGRKYREMNGVPPGSHQTRQAGTQHPTPGTATRSAACRKPTPGTATRSSVPRSAALS